MTMKDDIPPLVEVTPPKDPYTHKRVFHFNILLLTLHVYCFMATTSTHL